jgi:hypothetical protein
LPTIGYRNYTRGNDLRYEFLLLGAKNRHVGSFSVQRRRRDSGWNRLPFVLPFIFSGVSDLGCHFAFLAKLQGSKLGSSYV